MSDDLLSFKDFPPVHGGGGNFQSSAPPQINVNSPTHHKSTDRSDPLLDLINDMSNSVNVLSSATESAGTMNQDAKFSTPEDESSPKKVSLSPLSIEFYQRYFNVDTFMVVERIINSIIPKRAPPNYLKTHIGLNPDLYGPFWINITLIFLIAISGNIANYIQESSEDYKWKYNFHLVSYAATAIYVYVIFVPIIIWAVFKWSLKPIDADDIESETAAYTPSLLSVMCVYGYSLAIYIPVSILWVIQISVLQWLLVLTATFLSGSVLILVLTPALRNSKYSLFLMIAIMSLHFWLAAGFMLYFFHVPATIVQENQNVTESIVKAANDSINQKT